MMRKLMILALCMLATKDLYSQHTGSDARDFNPNVVKINLFSLPFRSLSVQYERGLNARMSVSLGARLMPKGPLPFQSSLRNSMDVETGDTTDAGLDFINNASVSNWAITPEFRYYFGKKPLNGFYVAPFLRVGSYGIDWNYNYELNDGTQKAVHLKGRGSAISGGVLLGAQWHLGERLLLDWWILGPQYGSYNIRLEAIGDFSDLTDAEKKDLETTIEGIGYSGNKFEAAVTNTSVKATNRLGFPGLRTGFCIGFTF